MNTKQIAFSFIALFLNFYSLAAQEEKSAEELAKMAQNPLANMMSFPFQDNTTFGNGPNSDRTSNVWKNSIQPSSSILLQCN